MKIDVYGSNPKPQFSKVRHSRMLLAGIQGKPELDPRLKHSGVTPLGVASLRPTRQIFEGGHEAHEVRISILAALYCSRAQGARYETRNFGSSASRSESPKRLKAKTPKLIARPGKMAIHGALSANSTAAPLRIKPQAGVGSATPRTRKEIEASSRIACPKKALSMM